MRLMLTTIAIVLCPVAQAQNPARGWYVGLDAGMSQIDADLEDLDNDVTVDLRGIGVQFTGRIPISEKVGILAHVIAMNRRLDVSARGPGQVPQSDYHGGIVHRWGLGVNYQFNPQWDLRLEHSHSSDIGGTLWSVGLDLDLKANLRTTTLGLRYKFPRS